MENNMLPGETHETHETATADNKPRLTVGFKGTAEIKEKKKEESTLISEFIPSLNQHADEIALEIRTEIRNSLPPGFDVKLNISFSPGSLDFQGFAYLLDIAGKIVDGVDFTKIAINIIKFGINKVIRRRIEPHYQVTKLTTKVKEKKLPDAEYPLTRFLWWCGGTSKAILRDSTFGEKAKYVGMGGVLVTTGVLACASGGYAMYTVFASNRSAPLVGILFGLLWGLIIFNLDRYIVTSMKKELRADGRQDLRAELRPAWPRFIVALLLGVTISVPLELRLFKPEIEQKIKFNEDVKLRSKGEELNRRFADRMSELDRRVNGINHEITGKEQQVNDLRDAFYQEMDRRGGTRVYGYGPVARRKEEEFLRVEMERRLEIDSLSQDRNQIQNEIVQIDDQKRVALAAYRQTLGQGILERISALSELSKAHLSVFLTTVFVSLLLIFFELAPVLVKVLSKFGPYDAKLDLREEAEVARAKNMRKSFVQIDQKHYENMTNAEIAVEETVHQESVAVRKEQIIQEYQRWADQRSNGQSTSYKDFLTFIGDNFYGERDYPQ